MAKRTRDYKAEYRHRIERNLAKGYTRGQARGHPGKGQRHISQPKSALRYDRRLEMGLKEMRKGKSLKGAARSVHVSPERLRNYVQETGVVRKERRRWVVSEDHRPREIQTFSGGHVHTIVVPGYESAALVGRYMAAVREFLRTNDRDHLIPFIGEWVTDVDGKVYPFETRPNVLYRLHASGIEPFEEVYRLVG
jgi:hypothetical protein